MGALFQLLDNHIGRSTRRWLKSGYVTVGVTVANDLDIDVSYQISHGHRKHLCRDGIR
jgi:hypothetical protein